MAQLAQNLNNQAPIVPTVPPQRMATASGSVALGQPGSIVVPEIPKDALTKKTPSVWFLVAVIELIVIIYLLCKLYKMQQHDKKKS